MLTRLIVIGVRIFGDRIIIASDLFSFKTSPLSHIFTSRTQASIRSKACVCSDGVNVTYNWVSSAYRCNSCNSFANGATYALNSIGPRTDPWGTPVVMVFSCETLLFTHTTFV